MTNVNKIQQERNKATEAMPQLKQPVPLRDLAMDLMVTFFSNFFAKHSTEDTLEKLRQGSSFIKTDISPHIPWKMAADFHEKLLLKFFYGPDYKPLAHPDDHKRAVLEIIMDRKIIGLKCINEILSPLGPEDARRILGLEELDVSFFNEIPSPYGIENFHLEDLTKLSFDFTCTDEALEIIGRSCRKLRYLSASGSEEITDNGLRSLHPCSELRELGLCRCTGLTHAGIYQLIADHGKLEKVDSCDDKSIAADLTARYPSITSFSIGYGLRTVLTKHLRAVAVKFPNLTSLALSGHITGDLSVLKSLTKLAKIDLRDVSDYKWEKLEKLLTFVGSTVTDLRFCCTNSWSAITEDKLNFLSRNCGNLEHLEVYRVPDSYKETFIVPAFPKLELLVFVVPADYYDCMVDLAFEQMPSLETLVTSAIHFNTEGMESMILDHEKFPKLKKIITYDVTYGDDHPYRHGIIGVTPLPYDVRRMQEIAKDNNLDLVMTDVSDY